MQVAKTILEQLGGNRFAAMTGAKNFSAGDNLLQFSIGRNRKGINKVRITLDGTDTYTVQFFKIRKLNATLVQQFDGAYADQLQTLFTSATEMYTHF